MKPFCDELVEEFTRHVSAVETPTVNDVLTALRCTCESVDLENRSDISFYSVMAETVEVDHQSFFLLSLHFELNRSITGAPIDVRDSIDCEFSLDAPIDGEYEPVEFTHMLTLDQIFASIKRCEPFHLVKDRSLPFKWTGPSE